MVWFSFRPKEEVVELQVRKLLVLSEQITKHELCYLLNVDLPQLYAPFHPVIKHDCFIGQFTSHRHLSV